MTPDRARKLSGGYAAGTLTPEERRALFDAALRDQALFEELAREQPLKQVLDDPALRAEVLHALNNRLRRSRWIWTVTGAAGLAIVSASFLIIMHFDRLNRPPAPIPMRIHIERAHWNPLRAEASSAAIAPQLVGNQPFQLRYSIHQATDIAPGIVPEITLETNAPASLYAFYRNRSGDWIPLTPGGLNLATGLESGLPPAPAGVNLLLIVSKRPIPDLAGAARDITAAVERVRATGQPPRIVQTRLSNTTTIIDPEGGSGARIVTIIPLARRR